MYFVPCSQLSIVSSTVGARPHHRVGKQVRCHQIFGNLGLDAPSYTGICWCLEKITGNDYRSKTSKCCFSHVTAYSLSLLPCDVTTLYFEVQEEDEHRKPGMSKERRLEPQITVELLVDRDGFPLEAKGFEGNKAEAKTIMAVLDAFKERCGLAEMTVAADAAMLSSANIQALEDAGYHCIIGSCLAKTLYEIAEFAKEPGSELEDGQVFDTIQAMSTGKETVRVHRRATCQYGKGRAALALRDIGKLLDKAQKMAAGTAGFRRTVPLQ